MDLKFSERAGHRNIDVPFACFMDGYKLQFNKVADDRYFLSYRRNFYVALDKKDKSRYIYIYLSTKEDGNKTHIMNSGRFPYIEVPELQQYFKSNKDIYFLMERHYYGSLAGFKLTRQ